MQYIAYAQRGELEKCAEESFDCVSCGCCSVRCPAGISHPMVGLLARRLTGKYIAPKSEHLEKRVEEIHEGKFDDMIEKIMQKPITEMQELYNSTDPVSNYERQQYPNLRDYINAEVIPEMQKKLRQGFGRAIRTEQDSCVVAILDERAGIGGKYHDAALAALPACPTTEKIEDVQQFIREQKRPDYFCKEGLR